MAARGFPIFLIEGFYFMLTNADVIIVGLYLPPEKVAVYFAAAKTMALVHFVYFAVKAAAAQRFLVWFQAATLPRLRTSPSRRSNGPSGLP
jgi:O-antigen/teichoic acid export membrane protein